MEVAKSARFIPNAVIVRSKYSESIVTWRNIRIVGHPSGTRIYPIFIKSFQLILEFHPLWKEQAQCRVMNLQLPCAWRHIEFLSRVDRFSVNKHLLNDYRRQ